MSTIYNNLDAMNNFFDVLSDFNEYRLFNEMFDINTTLDFTIECKMIPTQVTSQEYNKYGESKK